MGLAGPDEEPRYTTLTGGVSSAIWRVDLRDGPICVKRALPKLATKQDWFAPVARWRDEVEYLRVAAKIVPDAVPRVFGTDPARGLFAMEFFPPLQYPLWKTRLRHGVAEWDVAAKVGRALAQIHGATARRPDLLALFPGLENFRALRLDPYLGEIGRRHPDLAPPLDALIETTAATRLVLVHGDVSPKNILVGDRGPVFLDAECAWYGDPAFDLAFCLNHLLLKCLWVPRAARDFMICFDGLRGAYLSRVDWEPADAVEGRAAALLPALLLARVDGKSPVEYIKRDTERNRVRRVARPLILSPAARLDTIVAAWTKELAIG